MPDLNINPGELNKRITIWRPFSGEFETDKDGFKIENDKKIRSCWARYTQQSGNEVLAAGSTFSETKARFLVRYSKTHPIDEDMYIMYAGRRYEIEYINQYGDSREYLEIWCNRRERV